MIGPEGFHLWVEVAVDARDDEEGNEDDVSVDPDVVGDEVLFLPVDGEGG